MDHKYRSLWRKIPVLYFKSKNSIKIQSENFLLMCYTYYVPVSFLVLPPYLSGDKPSCKGVVLTPLE